MSPFFLLGLSPAAAGSITAFAVFRQYGENSDRSVEIEAVLFQSRQVEPKVASGVVIADIGDHRTDQIQVVR